MEIWKDIENYEGLYQVSNLGRIRTCKRKVEYFNPKLNRISSHTVKSKIKTPSIKDNGYMQVTLNKDNIGRSFYVHRLVAQAFISNPDNKKTVNHKDFNKQNNKAENLEWATYKEQEHHKILNHGKTVGNTKNIIIKFKNGYEKEYISICEAARELNINRQIIYNIMNGAKNGKAKELNIDYITRKRNI